MESAASLGALVFVLIGAFFLAQRYVKHLLFRRRFDQHLRLESARDYLFPHRRNANEPRLPASIAFQLSSTDIPATDQEMADRLEPSANDHLFAQTNADTISETVIRYRRRLIKGVSVTGVENSPLARRRRAISDL